jgi:AcrR family transcriptional regulator
MEINEHGYTSSTVGGIARRAHVSIRTFYEHFSGKEALFLEAYGAGVEAAEAFVENRIAQCESWPSRLLAYVRSTLEIVSRSGDYELGLLIGSISAGPKALARRAIAQERWSVIMRRELRYAHEADPELPQSVIEVGESLAIAVVAGGEGLLHQALGRSPERVTESLLPTFVYFVASVAGLSLASLRALDADRPYRAGLPTLVDLLTRFEHTRGLDDNSDSAAVLL